jgi:hypothetical protein
MEHGDQSAKWGKLGTINHGMASIGLCFVAQPISELWIVSSSRLARMSCCAMLLLGYILAYTVYGGALTL